MPEVSSHTPGAFCWVELATPDAEASKNFYSELLGWTWTDMPMSDSMVYTMHFHRRRGCSDRKGERSRGQRHQ